jgi:AraC-like DNA-binding protein
MKLIFENIRPDADSSFRIFEPRLNDFFFWHFHPEYELVYIEAAEGTRHVGEHIGRFAGSDLILIGPHIPHLNFDYGIHTPYHKVVVQMREDFLEKGFQNIPELRGIQTLFEKAKKGIHFTDLTKNVVGERLKNLQSLPRFEQLMEMLRLFHIMANAADGVILNAQMITQHYNLKEQQRLKSVYRYIEDHFAEKIEVEDMARLTHFSKAAFCRYFKKMTLLTFTDFLNQYRVNHAKTLLLQDKSITEVCFESGFESLSYFNRVFKSKVGEQPLKFKKRHFLR